MKNIPRAKEMNINVASWGRLLKRSTPSIQNQNTVDSAASTPSTPSSGVDMFATAQPLHLNFDQPDEFETVVAPGENPDMNIAGLSGARPLGMHFLFHCSIIFIIFHNFYNCIGNFFCLP